jgi:hypothetical protein
MLLACIALATRLRSAPFYGDIGTEFASYACPIINALIKQIGFSSVATKAR